MRHDNLARALRLVASYAGLQSALEPLYRALARGAGVELNRRGDVVVVMPRLEMAAVVVTHAPAASYVAAAARETGATAERAEDRKRDRFRRDVPDHAAVTMHEPAGSSVVTGAPMHDLRITCRGKPPARIVPR